MGGLVFFAHPLYTGCIKKNKTLLFSPNFQPKSLRNGWSDLLKNHCAKSPHCGLFAQEISSDSDKWFPSYCGWKLGEKKSVLFFLIHPVYEVEADSNSEAAAILRPAALVLLLQAVSYIGIPVR